MRVMVEADEVLWMDILQIYFIIFKIYMGDMMNKVVRKTFYYSRLMLPKIYNYRYNKYFAYLSI